MEKSVNQAFVRVAKMMDERTLIKSTCQKCGAAKIASHADDSLEKWESNHSCASSQVRANEKRQRAMPTGASRIE
jgi:hypothetical protein